MREWLRTRRVWVLGATTLSCLLALGFLTRAVVPVPVDVGAPGLVLWTTFLPLVWALGAIDVFASKAQSVEARPAPLLTLVDAALFVLTCLVGAVVFAWGAVSVETPWGAAAHVLVLTGLGTWVTLHRGPAAGALASSGLLLLTTCYGIHAPYGPQVRVLQPDGDLRTSLALGVVLCAGALLTILAERGRVDITAEGPDATR